MIDSILLNRGYSSSKVRVSIKSLISVCVIALSVVLPQLAHIVIGGNAGMTWLPMYLPVLLGGCLLGVRYGVAVGVLSPLVSFALTSIMGNPMPLATRLPFMVVELGIFGAVSGAFSASIVKNDFMAFVSVLCAEIVGRSVFLLSVCIFNSVVPFTPSLILSQIKMGLSGLILSFVLVPTLVIITKHMGMKNSND